MHDMKPNCEPCAAEAEPIIVPTASSFTQAIAMQEPTFNAPIRPSPRCDNKPVGTQTDLSINASPHLEKPRATALAEFTAHAEVDDASNKVPPCGTEFSTSPASRPDEPHVTSLAGLAINKAPQSALARSARKTIVQIGCGVVGHAYAQAFVNVGHVVRGVEASRARMAALRGAYPLHHVSEDLSGLRGVDFILLSINTPLDAGTGALDMRFLWSSAGNVAALLAGSPRALVVVRSTVTLGFCAQFRAALAARAAAPVRLCFQPEFLRAASALADATRPWQVVLGCEDAAEVADYRAFQEGFVRSERIALCSVDEAEIMKIFHNSFNAMKISYFNQAHLLVQRIAEEDGKQIDAEKTFKIIARTCEGLLNPLYGLTPGHAYYGTCLPKDSAELAHMEKAYGLECSLFRSVVEVNDVVRRSDKEEVLHGDNHAGHEVFHARLPEVTPQAGKGARGLNGVKQAMEKLSVGPDRAEVRSPAAVSKEDVKGAGKVGKVGKLGSSGNSPSAVQAEWHEMRSLKQASVQI